MSLPVSATTVEIPSTESVMLPMSMASTGPLVSTTESFPHNSAVALSMLGTSAPSVYQSGKKASQCTFASTVSSK